jgi:dCTP deaminase
MLSLKNDVWIKSKGSSLISPFTEEKVTFLRAIHHTIRPLPDRVYGNITLRSLTEFDLDVVKTPVLSYGLSGFGYDVTLSPEVKIFNSAVGVQKIIDPKKFDESILSLAEITRDKRTKEAFVCLPPGSFSLGCTVEQIFMPDNVMAFFTCKSSYARCGVHINNTTIQPGFKGQVVIELTNSAPLPVKVYLNEGIGQLVFFEGESPLNTYSGIYQDQIGVKVPEVSYE